MTRLAGLDALRGVAAISVVLYHFNWCYARIPDVGFAPSLSFSLGHYGVDLFFVISGFVIFMTLERATSLRSFALSRFARLYPTFWVALCVAIAARALDGRLTVNLTEILANATMVPVVFGAPFVDGVYWTLFHEIVFYVFVGAFFTFGGKRPEVACCYWLLGAICVVYGGLSQCNAVSGCQHVLLSHRTGLFLVVQSASFSYLFVIGITVYRLCQNPHNLSNYTVLLMAFCFACGFSFVIRHSGADAEAGWGHVTGIANGGLAAALAVAVWVGARLRLSGVIGAALLFLGEISYSLYLVHQEVGYSLLHLGSTLGLPDDLSVVLTLMFVIAIARVINKYIERPAQRWIKNWYACRQETSRVALAG